MTAPLYRRVFLLVLDSVGIGAMPDAARFGDEGAHTLGHAARARGGLKVPNLGRMGLGNIDPIDGVPREAHPLASFGKCAELSNGKDTTTGHWEMAGIHVKQPFPTYYGGFPPEMMESFVREAQVPGYLGNIPASGTEIIQKLGDEHVKTGKPIVYTSADSVFQIACHEESFGLDRLYGICRVARKLCDERGVARVIARPFVGSHGKYSRTGNRKDFSVALPEEVMMEKLLSAGLESVSIGKVASIYSDKGFNRLLKATNNREILAQVKSELRRDFRGLVFANLVDFDMLYGHRRNAEGYAAEIEWFDGELPAILSAMREDDLLILTADHGNDPTHPGSDHTREYVPLVAYSKRTEKNGGRDLGTRSTFADVGQTILDALGVRQRQRIGTSFLEAL
ncbi:MAG: phosphopentomutase [Bdellovibrionales bacterium]|nr:phosphopentomutase [Bdellovibrionales bacterium]